MGFLTLMLKERKVEGMSTNFAVHSPWVPHFGAEREEGRGNEYVFLSVFLAKHRQLYRLMLFFDFQYVFLSVFLAKHRQLYRLSTMRTM